MFQDWTATELRNAIKALEKALARGVSSVSYNGETVQYSTPSAMRSALADMRVALSKIEGGDSTPARKTRFYLQPKRGY